MVVIQDFVEPESIALEDSTARDLFSIAVFFGLGLLVSLPMNRHHHHSFARLKGAITGSRCIAAAIALCGTKISRPHRS